MRVECPDCEKDVLIENGYDRCPECGHSFTPTEAGDLVGGKRIPADDGYGSRDIYCGECGTDEVRVIGGKYVCFNCMQEWDEVSQCEWCHEYTTGDTEDSFFTGCSMCEGHSGWEGDKD
jgi:uncharacterized Zn ribbon protein